MKRVVILYFACVGDVIVTKSVFLGKCGEVKKWEVILEPAHVELWR